VRVHTMYYIYSLLAMLGEDQDSIEHHLLATIEGFMDL